jgi:3-phosphoshikimate 1-carboxyvinyltransferase
MTGKSRLLIRRQRMPLQGTIRVPGDKSISHRAIMLAAIANGHSTVRNWLPAGDTIATLNAVRSLGVEIEATETSPQSWDLAIEGRGIDGLLPPSHPLDCRNAGTCMRLLAGLLAGQRFSSTLDGSRQLGQRPMGRIIDPLQAMGAKIDAVDGKAPLHLHPGRLQGIDFQMKIASAQVKSAVLLAGLYASGVTTVHQPGPARDHTERMLAAMGADVVINGNRVTLAGGQALSPLNLAVPGDISSAAFPLVAAAIIPHSQITLANIGYNNTRIGILDMLEAMTVQLSLANQRVTGGEPAADIGCRFDELHSAHVSGPTVVRGIDEFPIWAVAATQAAGESSVHDAAELRVKEVDRITLLATELGKMGAEIKEYPDGFSVFGPSRLQGAEVDSHGDHRLGMALSIAGLVADGTTLINNADCIADSFPGYVEVMRSLGANMEWVA